MAHGRNNDQATLQAQVAERVRKLEVMPNPAAATVKKWRPTYEDLYAVAGHVYMLGCFYNPWHEDAGPLTVNAHPGQAAQYLWATLDQRGFANPAEGQDWTMFLYRLGALPTWDRLQASTISFGSSPPSSQQATEANSAFAFARPWARTGYSPAAGTGPPDFRSRALYWAGFPDRFSWTWVTPSIVNPATWPGIGGVTGYELWDDSGPFSEGWFTADIDENPIVVQANMWAIEGHPPPTPCDPIPLRYNTHTHPGVPFAYEASPFPCDNAPPAAVVGGTIIRIRLDMPWLDVYLTTPPRIAHPDLAGNSYSDPFLVGAETPIGQGPGLEWLAEGAAAILSEHPHVLNFYASYLPIAYAAKHQLHHHNYQQLDVSVDVRGRVEGKLYPDRAILKGALSLYSQHVPNDLFFWPPEWPQLDERLQLLAISDNGIPVAIGYVPETRNLRLDRPQDYEGPLTVRFNGTVVPVAMT